MTFVNPDRRLDQHADRRPVGLRAARFLGGPSSLTKLPVPVAGPWVVDWHDVTRDGQGNAVPFAKIDGVTIGFYEGMTVADLQARILDIELIATALWDIPLAGGRTADLAEATDRASGAAVPGLRARNRRNLDARADLQHLSEPGARRVLTILEPTVEGV